QLQCGTSNNPSRPFLLVKDSVEVHPLDPSGPDGLGSVRPDRHRSSRTISEVIGAPARAGVQSFTTNRLRHQRGHRGLHAGVGVAEMCDVDELSILLKLFTVGDVPVRHSVGTRGQPIQLVSNLYGVSVSVKEVFHYDVCITCSTAATQTPNRRCSFFTRQNHGRDLSAGGCRELWYGYDCSIRLGQWKPLLNVNISATLFHESLPLVEYVAKFLKKDPMRMLSDDLLDSERKKIEKELQAVKIE
ncbi:protein argonaute-3-like, partial [Tropilaelaps mercedesae]